MSDMSEQAAQEQQKKRLLEQLNQNASLYGERGMTEEELRRFRFTENSIPVPESVDAQYRERLKNMMMIDVVTANSLKDDYPDIVGEAEAEAKSIEETSKLSGAEKVKKDFFGQKRKAARIKLSEMNAKKAMLAAEKKRQYEASAETLLLRKTAMMNELVRKRDLEISEFGRQAYDELITGISNISLQSNGDDFLNTQYALEKGSDYELKNLKIMKVFNKRKPLSQYNPRTGDVTMSAYSSDRLIRDVSRFALKLDFGTEAEAQTENLTEEESLEMTANDLHVFADEIYVCTYGRHATTTFDGNGKPAAVKSEDQIAAFTDCHNRLKAKKPEIEEFQKKYPSLFKDHPNVDDMMNSYEDQKKLFNTLQTCSYICEGLLKGGAFKLISDKEREDFAETSTYLRGMKQYVETMGKYCAAYLRWLNHPAGDPPEFGGESYVNFKANIEFNKADARNRINEAKQN